VCFRDERRVQPTPKLDPHHRAIRRRGRLRAHEGGSRSLLRNLAIEELRAGRLKRAASQDLGDEHLYPR
jgi:ATP-dependent helicase YprA (DUF1998 family)